VDGAGRSPADDPGGVGTANADDPGRAVAASGTDAASTGGGHGWYTRGSGDEGGSSTAPTIYDVARAAGVSIASVSRVLNGQRNPRQETRERVLAAVAVLCGFLLLRSDRNERKALQDTRRQLRQHGRLGLPCPNSRCTEL